MSFSRRRALIAAGALAVMALPAFALQMSKFSSNALADAQKSGMPVLVEIHASWCPVCKVQKPIIDQLLSMDKFKSFVTLDMDFDTQKADVAALKANKQSTLIVYKGATEVGRSVGVTDAAAIEALLARAL